MVGVDKAYRPGKEKRTKTGVGDIVLDHKGKLLIATGMLPKAPIALKLMIKGQTITVAWSQERTDYEELAIPTTGFAVRFCPRPNPLGTVASLAQRGTRLSLKSTARLRKRLW